MRANTWHGTKSVQVEEVLRLHAGDAQRIALAQHLGRERGIAVFVDGAVAINAGVGVGGPEDRDQGGLGLGLSGLIGAPFVGSRRDPIAPIAFPETAATALTRVWQLQPSASEPEVVWDTLAGAK